MHTSLKAAVASERKPLCRHVSCGNEWAIPRERPLLPAWLLRNRKGSFARVFGICAESLS